MLATSSDWGWTSYKKTSWKTTDGSKCYEARFQTHRETVLSSYEEVWIRFWAHHPIAALREIAESGKHPSTFHGKQVN